MSTLNATAKEFIPSFLTNSENVQSDSLPQASSQPQPQPHSSVQQNYNVKQFNKSTSTIHQPKHKQHRQQHRNGSLDQQDNSSSFTNRQHSSYSNQNKNKNKYSQVSTDEANNSHSNVNNNNKNNELLPQSPLSS